MMDAGTKLTIDDIRRFVNKENNYEKCQIMELTDIELERVINELDRLNNIINTLEDSIVGKINVLYQVKGQPNAIQELNILLRQLRELKGEDKE